MSYCNKISKSVYIQSMNGYGAKNHLVARIEFLDHQLNNHLPFDGPGLNIRLGSIANYNNNNNKTFLAYVFCAFAIYKRMEFLEVLATDRRLSNAVGQLNSE